MENIADSVLNALYIKYLLCKLFKKNLCLDKHNTILNCMRLRFV